MRDLIKQQLQNCSYTNLSNFNQETQTFIIPKYKKPQFILGNMYLVQLSNSLVNNPNSVVAVNYNNGTAPNYTFLKIFVSKSLGKLIYVDSLGFDPNTKQDINIMWSGWLPTEDLTIISQIVI